jgi:uncharacterized DUF497 family protein
VRITFDPAKDAGNVAKHGISLALATELEWDEALSWPDDRRDYREARWCALAPLGNRLHFVTYVERDGALRIISLRKANSREVKRYAEDYQD